MKTLEELKAEFIEEWIVCNEEVQSAIDRNRQDLVDNLNEIIRSCKSDIDAVIDKAQDELIEKICKESHNTNGISTDRGIVTFLTETPAGYDISEISLIDWLKSLKV